jgi:hypothetical protein
MAAVPNLYPLFAVQGSIQWDENGVEIMAPTLASPDLAERAHAEAKTMAFVEVQLENFAIDAVQDNHAKTLFGVDNWNLG